MISDQKISFNIPTVLGDEKTYVLDVINGNKFSGDGLYNQKVSDTIKRITGTKRAFTTPSCTGSLELSALILDIKSGDEVIMPSYTFTSTAIAFVLRGAKIIFVDIRSDTMNIDESKIEAAITKKTKAIVPVHYAGVACEMDEIMRIAKKHKLWVIEDAAQAILSSYKGRMLGSIGHLGCLSFHETKNIQCGEGGALLVNDSLLIEKAEISREKGTDRSKFFRGEINKYSWVDTGSSYLLSEITAAFLYSQLLKSSVIINDRMKSWLYYYNKLLPLAKDKFCVLPVVPPECKHNGHIFYIKVKDSHERQRLIDHLNKRNIRSVFHYLPLHSSKAGKKFGFFKGEDIYTTKESERILRLPLFYDIKKDQLDIVINEIKKFYSRY